MAIIVQMPSPRPRAAEAATIEAGATILFFTGVRYERDIDFEVEDPDCDVELELALSIDQPSAVAVV